jgi:putative oxidoreductase
VDRLAEAADPAAHDRNFRSWGIPAPEILTPLVSGVEFVCGILILLGLLTRFAAVPLMIVMVVAVIATKRADIDSLVTLLGFEEISYFVMFSCLAIAGPGPVSLDRYVLAAIGRKPASHGA